MSRGTNSELWAMREGNSDRQTGRRGGLDTVGTTGITGTTWDREVKAVARKLGLG